MHAHVLVTYASKYGSTKQIAEHIVQILRQATLKTDLQPVDDIHNLADYTAVILGSAVYAGRWLNDAVYFLKNHEAELTHRDVWFFSSGPTGSGDPVALMKGWHFPTAQQPIADRIHPHDMALFHGAIDTERLNLAERLIIRGVGAPVGDFRDWSMIEAWARGIAHTLTKEDRSTLPVSDRL